MKLFQSSKISHNNESIGEQLEKRRKDLDIMIETASQKLNINAKYLIAIEKGQFEKLPYGVYKKKYIEEYARFLRVNPKELWEESKEGANGNKEKKDPFKKRCPASLDFISIPNVIKGLLVLAIVLVCFFYLGYYLKNIFSPPELSISYPPQNFTTDLSIITIAGKTDPRAQVSINNQEVLVSTSGFFSKELNLKKGINVITVVSQKKYSRENERIITVLAAPPDVEN